MCKYVNLNFIESRDFADAKTELCLPTKFARHVNEYLAGLTKGSTVGTLAKLATLSKLEFAAAWGRKTAYVAKSTEMEKWRHRHPGQMEWHLHWAFEVSKFGPSNCRSSVLVWFLFFCIANEQLKKCSLKFIKKGKVNAKNSRKTNARDGRQAGRKINWNKIYVNKISVAKL